MRLLLTHEFGDQDVDSAANMTFARLRDDAAGMKLALHCTSWRTWLSVKVLWLGGQPLWTWYAGQVQNVKCPEQELGHLKSLAGGKWLQDSQFRCLVKVLLQSEEFIKVGKYLELAEHQLGPNPETCMGAFVEELFFYCTSLLSKRASSASKSSTAPEVYVEYLSGDLDEAQQALNHMLADWKLLTLLEQSASNQGLARDMRVSVPPLMRVIFQLAEHGRHLTAQKLLKAILKGFPDSKLIEDVHGCVRNDARANANKSQTFAQIQQVILGSNALESRAIRHPAALTRDVFTCRWKKTSGKRSWKAAFVPKSEKIPKKYSQLLGAKSWDTISEDTLQRASAGWELARYYVKFRLNEKRIALHAPLLLHVIFHVVLNMCEGWL